MNADNEHRQKSQRGKSQNDKPQRDTVQRRVILEELRRSAQHPTAGELYRAVRDRLPRISLGTVYRNLEVLVAAKQIRKLEGSGKEARFDPIIEEHYHVRCLECGRIDDLTNPPAMPLASDSQQQDGWKIVDHRVEFVGTCPDCLKSDEDSEQKVSNDHRSHPARISPPAAHPGRTRPAQS